MEHSGKAIEPGKMNLDFTINSAKFQYYPIGTAEQACRFYEYESYNKLYTNEYRLHQDKMPDFSKILLCVR